MLTSKYDSQEVIEAGHPPVAKGIVCVDFDGTIFPFGQMDLSGTMPIKRAVSAVQSLKDEGYTIVIFSSRFSKAWHDHEGWDHDQAMIEQTALVKAALDKWQIPYDRLTAEKIPAVAYFDDKAWRAEGDMGLWFAVGKFLREERQREANARLK